uniref:Elongation of very long chain fatty acids protein n=1 Tax=Meloidogyne incognita TaxID=6306 RepID=A0A914KW63_MELIC
MLGINEFEIYQNNNTKTLHSDYVYRFALPFERVHDKVGWTSLFQRYWYHSITVSLLYYVFVRLLQRLMRDRQPFQLRVPLIVWNFVLAIFSFAGLVRFSEDFLYNLTKHGLVYSICHSCNPDSVAAFWSLLFAFSKIVEFGDTLFIVLRKRKLIFLHYYHHAAVFVYTIHSGTEHTAPGQAFISMNFLAHSAMYSYYTAKSCGIKVPRIIAMAVTSIQTAQMFLGVAVSTLVLKLKLLDGYRCQQSWANLILAFAIYASFALLFVRFFVDAYLHRNRKRKEK